MNGIIILTENYTYEGKIVNKYPHGHGTFQYANGDKYIGNCHIGKPDGYGIYYFSNNSKYTGFFSNGKINGIGTFNDNINVYKGTWRNDKKHGSFYKTIIAKHQTWKQLWMKDKLIATEPTQYLQPSALNTTKVNPIKSPKVYQTSFKGVEKVCMACMERPTNAANTRCGHVVMCYDCLSKCTRCPICRSPIHHILKLFVS